MSVYHGKLLELLAINRKAGQSFLHIRLSFFEQEMELLWEIDQETAENMESLSLFEKDYKYRLSFDSQEHLTNQQYISFLTKTYQDHSERIYFFCSEKYIQNLQTIKYSQHISKLHTLPFLSTNLPKIVQKREQGDVVANRSNGKFSFKTMAMLWAVLIILCGYSFQITINKTATAYSQKVSEPIQVENLHVADKMVEMASVPSEQDESHPDTQPESSIPTVELDKLITYSLPEGNVALTFDDGPSKYSKEITDILNNYGVGGTFFFTGLNVKKYPEYVQYVNTHGYSIGNHSMNHINFTRYAYEHQENELIHTNQLIEEIILEPVVLFRPPYGAMNDVTIELVENVDNKLVLWNRDTEDWKHRNPDEIIKYILNSNVSGTIILLHESQAVVDALPQIIEHLLEKELQVVSLK